MRKIRFAKLDIRLAKCLYMFENVKTKKELRDLNNKILHILSLSSFLLFNKISAYLPNLLYIRVKRKSIFLFRESLFFNRNQLKWSPASSIQIVTINFNSFF